MGKRKFRYVIKSKEGKIFKGIAKAESEEELKEGFRQQGFLVFQVNEETTDKRLLKMKIEEVGTTIITLILLALIGAGSYIYYQDFKKRQSVTEQSQPSQSSAPAQDAARDYPVVEGDSSFSKERGEGKKDEATDTAPLPIDVRSEKEGDFVKIMGQGAKIEKKQAKERFQSAEYYYRMAMQTNWKQYYSMAIEYAQRALLYETLSLSEQDRMKEIIRRSRKSRSQ